MNISKNYQKQTVTTSYKQEAKNTGQVKEQEEKLENQEPSDVLELSKKTKGKSDVKATYTKPEPLTPKQIQTLKQRQEASEMELLKNMAKANITNQSGQAMENDAALLTEIFGSIEEALPPLATTPEGAAEAIAPGGDYSVEKVAERIMDMAKALSGGDASKIEELQKAVQRGFEEAGMNLETGEGLPEISYDTYKEVMNQFEVWKQA